MTRRAQGRPGSQGLKGTHMVGRQMNLTKSWLRSGAFSMHGVTRNRSSVCLFHFEFPFSVLATRYMLPVMLMAANRSL